MNVRVHKTLLVSALTVAVLAGMPLGMAGAHAEHNADDTITSSTTNNNTHTTTSGDATHSGSDDGATHAAREASDDTAGTHSAPGKRLGNASLRVCERRQTKINAIMDRSNARAKRQIALFTTIADRTKAFYVQKGHTLANYDELVAAVDSAKVKAEADLAALPTDFACDSPDPKGTASSFKEGMKQEITDLKALKTAVKNLIVGVKSVQAKEEQ